MLLKSLSFSFFPILVTLTKVPSKHKILDTKVLQKVPSNTKFWLQQFTKISFKHKIQVTVTKVPSNKIFRLQLQKSFKQNILVTVTKVPSNKIFWLHLQKFLQTQYSGYSLQKVPSNTMFWLQFKKSSFKHKIPVTVTKVPSNKIFLLQLQNFLQQNSGYKFLTKIPKLLLTREVFLVVQSTHFYIEVITVAKTCVPFQKKQNILILSP